MRSAINKYISNKDNRNNNDNTSSVILRGMFRVNRVYADLISTLEGKQVVFDESSTQQKQ